jgi:iron complex transport system permease protein
MALALGPLGTPLASFGGALAVMGVVYAAAHRHGRLDSNMLLLSGVMVGAFINAAILVLIALLNQELRTAFLWLMGNLSNATLTTVAWLAPVLLALCGVLLYLARSYNLVATGEESALQLGVDVVKVKRVSYVLASLVTGLVVSVSGVVGFVGLIVPHVCRMLFGPDHRLLLPASFLAGAAFLIAADLVARTLIAPTELPVGAVTAAVGAPVFLYLLKKT